MNLIDRSRNYFRASKEELLAVTWPSREDITRYTGLVIATVIVFGIFFTALDLVINTGVEAIITSKTGTTQNAPAPIQQTPGAVNVSPVEVEATNSDGGAADIKVEQVPVAPNTPAPVAPVAN
jgi:preprotein translocase subunit SecE